MHARYLDVMCCIGPRALWLILVAFATEDVRADAVADFYRGKEIRLIISTRKERLVKQTAA